MTDPNTIDGLLVQWGDRYLFPGNQLKRGARTPKLRGSTTAERAAYIRERIAALVQRRAPQVMVKVTGGGRGMKAIAAHFRYISKHGRLEMEDDQGQKIQGKDAVREMADDWRYGGSLIPEKGGRREALNIMLSMPRGTDPLIVQKAAREFAHEELAGHKWVMVVHDHQANPHVHLSVRAESRTGQRLNPRKADLRRWRETFAAKLRERGIEAEASRQATRGMERHYPALWQMKARADGRLLKHQHAAGCGAPTVASQDAVQTAWRELAAALASAVHEGDRQLARSIDAFAAERTVRLMTHSPELHAHPQASARTSLAR